MSVVVWAAATDVGRARERNEDSWFGGRRIYAVADGLGGHRAGEVASRMAVEALARLDRSGGPGGGAGGGAGADPGAPLAEAIREANRAVTAHAAREPETAGMATTMTAVLIDGGVAHLAHVGDSRCYLLRGDQMTLVSTDHTLVGRMVDEGAITLEQAETHPQRSVLTRAVGTDPHLEVDRVEIPLAPSDRLLLCSDGLSSVVPESEIAGLLASVRDLDGVCRALIDEANRRGGPDNITVVVLDVPADADLPAHAPALVVSGPADGASAAGAAVASPPMRPVATADQVRARARRRLPRRAIVWTAVVVVVVAGGFAGLRIWADRSWYVAFDGDRVSIFRGLQTDFVISLHRVHQQSELARDDVAPFWVDRLNDGIPAASLPDAAAVVERIRRAGPPGTPILGASPSPSPSSSVSPSPSSGTPS